MFRISDIDVMSISVPLKTPLKLAGITIGNAENIIVRIADSDGTVGWGEASSAPTMTGETPEGMVSAVKFMKNGLLDLEIQELSNIHPTLEKLMYGNQSAKAAIEMALVDIAAKRLNAPAYEVLGGAKRTKAPVISMIAGAGQDNETANALKLADLGFVAFKVKVGVGSAESDLARCRSVRQALGPEQRISADANQGYEKNDALTFAKSAGDAGLDFFEQPVAGHDLETMQACARAASIPLGADEGLHSIEDIRRHHEAGAASGGSLKTIKLGGLYPVLEAANLMQELGMNINLAGKIADTTIGSSMIAHLALVLPQLNWDVSITNQYLAADLVDNPLQIDKGHISVTDAPGFGFEPSEQHLQKFTVG